MRLLHGRPLAEALNASTGERIARLRAKKVTPTVAFAPRMFTPWKRRSSMTASAVDGTKRGCPAASRPAFFG